MDIVYILKDTKHNEELRYSLRSLKNVKGIDRVVFAGGYPEDFECDYHIDVYQNGDTKYMNTTKILRAICEDETLSDDIVLMNDDFFVMKPIDLHTYKNSFNGTLAEQIFNIEKNNGNKISRYTNRLRQTYLTIGVLGNKDPLNFETHTPFVANRIYARKIINHNLNCVFRTLYMSVLLYGKVKVNDHKIADMETKPNGKEVILSTTDESFKNGYVGQYIRRKFKTKCKYEK